MGKVENDHGSSHCHRCAFEQLESLYQLNVEAKRYAAAAEDAYTAGLKSNARLYSLRKKALYGLKRAILGELIQEGCVNTVRTHEIHGKAYYCLYVGEFSFHTPTEEWDEPPLCAPTSPTKSLDSFDANPENRPDRLTEREALELLTERFETPNNYLEAPFVERSYNATFAGWSYLPGAMQEGDRVGDRFKSEHRRSDFLFDEGDTFQTREGECEILDCYHAWLTPLWDRSPLTQREVYDVRLDGEVRETVRQQRIVDDWRILADSLHDPVPNVSGKQADIVGKDTEVLVEQAIKFEIGDIIELRPKQEGGDPYYCKISEANLSYTLLLCEFEPVPPSEEAPLGLSVSAFADDVVAVHDEPPKTV
ncbi:hypothetical protein ACLI4U_18300 [Natrialbaceae archaeon A-CW2]